MLLPDHDGTVHGDLAPGRVRALCDRRAGLGGDGVIRVIRSTAAPVAGEVGETAAAWFMDYRNADGSSSEMCGNGIRVLARHLIDTGLVDDRDFAIATRDGDKQIRVDGDLITVDLGRPELLGETTVAVGYRSWAARRVSTGNPHAVAFVSKLEDAGPLTEPPTVDPRIYPDGANVEFVVRRGERHVAMRVHERGSGETRSCGTGACAVMVAAADADGVGRGSDLPGRRPGRSSSPSPGPMTAGSC